MPWVVWSQQFDGMSSQERTMSPVVGSLKTRQLCFKEACGAKGFFLCEYTNIININIYIYIKQFPKINQKATIVWIWDEYPFESVLGPK